MTKRALSQIIALVVLVISVFGCAPVFAAPRSPETARAVSIDPSSVTVETMPSGMRLVLVPQPTVDFVTVKVLYAVGSRYDHVPGTAHFLEHLLFRGTTRRHAFAAVEIELDRLGASYNAGTGDEHTSYYATVESHRLIPVMDILHDMLTASLLRQEDIDAERGAVLQETRIDLDNQARCTVENLSRLMYPADKLGIPGQGTLESIRAISRADLMDVYRTYYVPGNGVLVIAGKFHKALARDLALAMFGADPPGAVSPPVFPKPTFEPGPRVSVVVAPGAAKANLALGFPSYGYGEGGRLDYGLDLADAVLTGSNSSRFFREIRSRRGLAYTVSASNYGHRGTGEFIVSMDLDPDRLTEALTAVIDGLRSLKEAPVPEDELYRAKEGVRVLNLLDYVTPEQSADRYGLTMLLHGFLPTPGAYGTTIGTVTPAEVQAAARANLRASRLFLAITVPPGKSAPYLELARQLGE